MKTYFRLIGYLGKYWLRLAIAVASIVVFAALDGVSMTLAIPLLSVLFDYREVTEGAESLSSQVGTDKFINLKEYFIRFQDWILAGDPSTALGRIILIIMIVFMLKNLFDYIQRYLGRMLEQLIVRDLRNELHAHLNEMSLSFFHRNKTGQLISIMSNDVGLIRQVLSDSFGKILMSLALVIVYLGLLFATSWKLTLMAFLIIPPMAGLVSWLARKLRRKNLWLQNALGEITSVFQEAIAGMRVVKAFNMQKFECDKFSGKTREYYHQYMRTNRYASLTSPLTEILMTIAGAAFLLYGGQQVIGGNLPASQFFFFLLVSMRIMSPVKALGNFNDILQQGLSACDRIFGVMDTEPEIAEKKDAVAVGNFEQSIRFENVRFAYANDVTVLEDINLEIVKGQAVAIVGPSGAGKSTLVDLIPRFYDVREGRILLDGHDIRDCRIGDLRKLIGIVTQEIILFNDSVRNNIAYGMKDIPLGRVIEAAEAANAHAFIESLDDGYETIIGERGTRLSGGQRQRISIARAILKNPEILIFDEATSSLDTESELLVQQAIERLMKDRTSLVIAHRLSTIGHCDRIVAMENGRIVESGSHAQLIGNGGVYSRLYELQFQSRAERP